MLVHNTLMVCLHFSEDEPTNPSSKQNGSHRLSAMLHLWLYTDTTSYFVLRLVELHNNNTLQNMQFSKKWSFFTIFRLNCRLTYINVKQQRIALIYHLRFLKDPLNVLLIKFNRPMCKSNYVINIWITPTYKYTYVYVYNIKVHMCSIKYMMFWYSYL